MPFSSILNIITCVSFYQLALIAFFNPTKVNFTANKWLALFFFSAGSMVLNFIIYQQKAENSYSWLIAFNELSRFVIAPALYLSVLQLTFPGQSFRAKWPHFVPFLLFFVYILPFVISHGSIIWHTDYLTANFRRLLAGFISLALNTQIAVYWLLSVYELTKHQKNIKLINSSINEIHLRWLQGLLFAIALMLLAWYAGMFYPLNSIEIYKSAAYLAGALLIGYCLLAQKEIYPFEKPDLESIRDIITSVDPIIPAQRLTGDKLNIYKDKLALLMQSERIYLDSELSLPVLADAMEISIHDLSYVLNKGLNITFFQFVNSYRVEEAKRLLLSKNNKHLNMLGIAYSAGFNSKTTFYTAFKKETGISPGQFLKSIETAAAAAVPFKN